MFFLKNKWLIIFNLFLLVVIFIATKIYYDNIPVRILFSSLQTANCTINKETFTLKDCEKLKIYLPADTKDVEFRFDNDVLLNSIKISKYLFRGNDLYSELNLKNQEAQLLASGDIKLKNKNLPTSFTLKTTPEIIKKRQDMVLFVGFLGVLLSFLLTSLLAFFITTKEKIISYLKRFATNAKVQKIAILCFWAILPLSFLYAINPQEATGLDCSWAWALNNFANNNALLPGADYAFTYGPLGFILTPLNYGNNLLIAIFSNLLCAVLITGLIFYLYKNKKIETKNLAIFALLFYFFSVPSPEWIWAISAYLLVLTILQQSNIKTLRFLSVLLGALSAFCLLLKMNLAINVLAMSVILVLILFIENRKNFSNYILFYAISFVGIFSISIKFLFLNMSNFIKWGQTSLEVAKGFSQSMVIEGSFFYLIMAAIIIVIYGCIEFWCFKRDKEIFKLILISLPLVFFSFKHGFVRQDMHMYLFFSMIFYIIGLVYLFAKEETAKKLLLFFIVTTLFSIIFCLNYLKETISYSVINKTITNIVQIVNFRENFQKSISDRETIYRQYILPTSWNAEIKDSTIEILPWELVYAQSNNWTNWRPNPILQLYSVYTKKLDEISANSFMTAKKPKFILLEFSSIDKRNMFLDTPATFNVILSSYKVVKSDKKRLLLKYNGFVQSKFKSKDVKIFEFDKTINLPQNDGNLYAKINIQPTLLGKIATFLFRGGIVEMEVVYANSNKHIFRVIPDNLNSPVAISHIPLDLKDLKHIINNTANNTKIKSIKFTKNRIYYKKNIEVYWFEKVYTNPIN